MCHRHEEHETPQTELKQIPTRVDIHARHWEKCQGHHTEKKKAINLPHGVGHRRPLSDMGWIISFSGFWDAIEKNEREGPTKASCRLDGEMGFLDASLRCILRTVGLGQKLCGEFLCSSVVRAHSEGYARSGDVLEPSPFPGLLFFLMRSSWQHLLCFVTGFAREANLSVWKPVGEEAATTPEGIPSCECKVFTTGPNLKGTQIKSVLELV